MANQHNLANHTCRIEGDTAWLQSEPVKGFIRGTCSRDDVSYQRPIVVGTETAR